MRQLRHTRIRRLALAGAVSFGARGALLSLGLFATLAGVMALYLAGSSPGLDPAEVVPTTKAKVVVSQALTDQAALDTPAELRARAAVEAGSSAPAESVPQSSVSLPGMANERTLLRLSMMRRALANMDDALAGAPNADPAQSALTAAAAAIMIELDVLGNFEVADPVRSLSPQGRVPRPPGTRLLAGGGRRYIIAEAEYPEYIAIGELCQARGRDAQAAPPLEPEAGHVRPVPMELVDAVRARCERAESLLGEAGQDR